MPVFTCVQGIGRQDALTRCRKAGMRIMEEIVETKVEALEGADIKLSVTVEAAEIDKRIKKTYKDYAYKYNFPGFRKGKAPRPVIDNAFGAEAVRAQVTDEVINEYFPLAVDAEDLFPQGQPEFGEPALVESGKDYAFEVTLSIKPELELSSYEPVEVALPGEAATDEEIEAQIEGLRDHYYTYENANANTKIKAESTVELSIKATDDDGKDIASISSESRIYTIGSGLLPETFDEQIMGLKKGEQKQFKIDNPGEASVLTTGLVGKTACISFDVTVVVLKKKVLPELTDEWVSSTLGFESVEELRERVVESIEQQKRDFIPRMKENQCLALIGERLEGEPPAKMCEDNEAELLQSFFQQLQQSGTTFDKYLSQNDLTSETFKEDVKLQAADTAKQDLALDAWARHFEITVTPEEVEAEFAAAGVSDPAALQEEWRRAGRLHLVRAGILRTKAVNDIMEKAIVKDLDEVAADEEPAEEAAE